MHQEEKRKPRRRNQSGARRNKMAIIKIYTERGFDSEIETADDLDYIEVDGERLIKK